MSGIFALCYDTIVAAGTAANHGGMINPDDVGPQGGCMAIIAIPNDPNMLAGRRSGLDTTCVQMATGALPGCTDKNSLPMTGLAFGDGMGKI